MGGQIGRIITWAVLGLGTAASVAQTLSYVETSHRWPAWVRMFVDISPPILSAIASLAILLGLGVGLYRLARFERWWDHFIKHWDAELRGWTQAQAKEVRRLAASEFDEIYHFRGIYGARLNDVERAIAEGVQWVHVAVSGRTVRLTLEAHTFFLNRGEVEQRKILQLIAASDKQNFFISEIREMAARVLSS